jgi:hypothetical protein
MTYSVEKMAELTTLLEQHTLQEGVNYTWSPDFVTYRESKSHKCHTLVYEPGIIILGQGKKECHLDGKIYDYSTGNYLSLFLPMPVQMSVVEASTTRRKLMNGIILIKHR